MLTADFVARELTEFLHDNFLIGNVCTYSKTYPFADFVIRVEIDEKIFFTLREARVY